MLETEVKQIQVTAQARQLCEDYRFLLSEVGEEAALLLVELVLKQRIAEDFARVGQPGQSIRL